MTPSRREPPPSLWRSVREILRTAERDFVAWADGMKRRSDAGEFGKWPWQKGYKDAGFFGGRARARRIADEEAEREAEG